MPGVEKQTYAPANVRSYAIRRVNPFLGVLQVIESEAGRAISSNGVVWDIEVLAERTGGWGSLNRKNHTVGYYRYGLWSLEDGLVNRPLASQLDSDPLTEQCNKLIDCIRERLNQQPFKLEDNYELWLFDQDDKLPIALLASAIPGSSVPSPEPKYWSSCIGAQGVPSQYRYPAASEIETIVKKRAGFNVRKHWIFRHDDGSGTTEQSDMYLPANALPPFLLTEDWPEPKQVRLAREFIDWIAPSLLTLQHLSGSERERLEKSLNIQAVSVEHHWHLYPELMNEKYLKAARVQCRLQQGNRDDSVQ